VRAGFVVAALSLAFLFVARSAGAWSAGHNGAPFSITEVSPGVYAVISLDPLGLANHSNAVFIVTDKDVVVVDTQFTLERTQLVRALLLTLTEKPVGTVINTHWHDDHTFGNQVYQGEFPDVQIIAQANTKEDMAGVGVENRKNQVAGGADAVAMFKNAIEKGVALDGTPLSDDEREAYQSTVEIAEEYLNDQATFMLKLPTRTFDRRLTLRDGGRTIELRYFGPAVTRGDAVVMLPKEGIVVTGDLVDNPMPFTYGCDVSGWIAALDSLQALSPKIIIPGHGPIMYDDSKIVLLKQALVAIRDQTTAAVGRGETLDQARTGIHLDLIRTQMAGDSKMMRFLFDGFFAGPAIGSAYEAASKAH
jgi:cyclase